MRARSMNLAMITVLALGLLAVACGGDDDDGNGDGDTPVPTNTAEAPETEEPSPEATATEDSGGEDIPSEISISAEGFAFSTGRLTMKAGVETTITMTNKDSVGHNLHIIAGSVNEAITPPFTADESPKSLTLTIEAPGTYQFQCDVHPTTMLGTLEVVE
ncbi:MAG: cupredoxin domain-containing protein [Dehalococcoidia bacterium]|nr:cupredoxin domain-containing protein [Dehalococcoidia bacterium]